MLLINKLRAFYSYSFIITQYVINVLRLLFQHYFIIIKINILFHRYFTQKKHKPKFRYNASLRRVVALQTDTIN